MATAVRYPACACHPSDLQDAPSTNLTLTYGSCARTCVFCNLSFARAPNLRRHAMACQGAGVVRVVHKRPGRVTRGHEWCLTPSTTSPASLSPSGSGPAQSAAASYHTASPPASSASSAPSDPESSLPPTEEDPASEAAVELQRQLKPPKILYLPMSWSFGDASKRHGISSMRSLRVSFLPAWRELQERLPWFDAAELKRLRAQLGPEFISHGPRPDIHQGIVTTQILRHVSGCDVETESWEGFWARLGAQSEADVVESLFSGGGGGGGRPLVIMLHWTQAAAWVDDDMLPFYCRLERLRARYGVSVSCIPRLTEALQARGKLGDLRALDEIAARKGQFRPVTCFPWPRGPCRLLGEERTVHKRQDSCGSAHVVVRTRTQRSDLSCSASAAPPSRGRRERDDGAARPLWFHQEFVDTFDAMGEFRVFICTEPARDGTRGRRGRVVGAARTTWKDSSSLYVEGVSDARLAALGCPHLTRDDLAAFCLDTFEELRRRPDWRERWESLEVGLRLDVALSPPRRGRGRRAEFWVVEATRWYSADFFSEDIQAEPKYVLCEEFAKSLDAYVRGGLDV